MSKHEKEAGKKLREKFNLRAKPGQVIPYSQADNDLRDRMKTLMKPIKAAPDSFEALITYGHPPLDKLGRVANRMIGVQQKFIDAFTRVSAAYDAINKGPDDAETKAIGRAVEEMIVGAGMGAKSEMTEEEQAKLIGKLHQKMAANIEKSVDVLKEADKNLEQLLDESRRVQRQRRDASREIGLHIGAAERLSEKFEGNFVKRAVKKYSKNWDADAKQRLKDVLKRGEDFVSRVEVLEGSRAASLIARDQLSYMRGAMQDQRKKIAEVLNDVENVWKPMLKSSNPDPFAPKP